MFFERTVSFYLRDFSTFFVWILSRVPLPADIQGWLYSYCSFAKPSLPLFDPWTAVCQASFTITLSLLKLMSIESVIPSNHLILSPSSPLALSFWYHQGLFQSSSHQGVKVLELQHQFFQWIFRVDFPYDWLIWSPCTPRDFQESSLGPQFKSFNSLAFSFLYGPSLTSMHD